MLGSADVLEDLLLLGALDGKVVIGSMNRGGLADTVFEIDDRFTGYDAPAIERMAFDGGKMLLRIDPDDPATAATLQACAHAVSDLAARDAIPVIGMGGVQSARHARDLIDVGAALVAVGTESFRDPTAAARIAHELGEISG